MVNTSQTLKSIDSLDVPVSVVVPPHSQPASGRNQHLFLPQLSLEAQKEARNQPKRVAVVKHQVGQGKDLLEQGNSQNIVVRTLGSINHYQADSGTCGRL